MSEQKYNLAMWMMLAFVAGILLRHFVDDKPVIVIGITEHEADSIGTVVVNREIAAWSSRSEAIYFENGYFSGFNDAMEYDLAQCQNRYAVADSIWAKMLRGGR